MSDQPGTPPPRPPGIVYTFYSYKGGVGRSMALVNVGVILASEGLRVLLVDWDLEAPGLEVFFRKTARISGNPAEVPGIVDLLEARAEKRSVAWRDCLLRIEFLGHSLDLITAGSRTDDYRRRVQSLDWGSLFGDHDIGNYMDELRTQWRGAYDVVLIDSRTGITDIGDICTVLLPDVLVLLFVTNHQNVEGTKSVMERAVKVRSKLPLQRAKLLGVPIPARDERDRESGKFEEWQRIFASEFAGLYRDWLPKEVEPAEALLRLFIPYVAAWSFGESIPVLESLRERADPSSLGAAYARLATLLAAKLDWSALDSKASLADLASARIEASASREVAAQAVEAQEQLESELAQSKKALATASVRSRRALIGTGLISAAVGLFGLWMYSQRAPPISALMSQLDSSDWVRRDSAARSLWLRHYELSPAETAQFTTKLLALRHDPDAGVHETAWMALATFDRTQALAAANALKDPEHETKFGAMMYLNILGPDAKQFAPDVAQILDDPTLREYAIDALSSMGADALRPYAETIGSFASSSDPGVGASAKKALATLGAASASHASSAPSAS